MTSFPLVIHCNHGLIAYRFQERQDKTKQSPQWLVDSLTAYSTRSSAHLRSSALSQQRAYTPEFSLAARSTRWRGP